MEKVRKLRNVLDELEDRGVDTDDVVVEGEIVSTETSCAAVGLPQGAVFPRRPGPSGLVQYRPRRARRRGIDESLVRPVIKVR